MKQRLYVAAVVAGLAAVGVLCVLVLGIGQYHPSPPSLTAHPVASIPGEIVYLDQHGCIVRVRASGGAHAQVACPPPRPSLVSWVDADHVGYASFGFRTTNWAEIDLRSGAAQTSTRFPLSKPGNPVSVKGERVDFDAHGSIYRVSNGERAQIYHNEGRESDGPGFVTWSPDGNWLLLTYRDELWIISRDGTTKGTLARSVSWGSLQTASWWIDGAGYLPAISFKPEPSGSPTP